MEVETPVKAPDSDAVDRRIDVLRVQYRHHAEVEHGTIINPITGEEVDIMQQCVNLQLDAGHHGHEVGDTEAYREVIRDFAEELRQDMQVWAILGNGECQPGRIHRVNKEDEHHVTYDFQYSRKVPEHGKMVDKVFILKDKPRSMFKTCQLLVKGDPAGGKTTFAKQLLTWIMREPETKWLVPVMVRTIDLVRCHASFKADGEDMVKQYLSMVYKDTPALEMFDLARQQGRLLVLLDGFDEAGHLEGDLAKQISAKLNNEVFLIVTSREMSGVLSGPDFARFRTVRVKELNEAQRRQVIKRRLASSEAVEVFCTQLTLNPALCLMTRNPLLLNVTLSVYESSGELHGRALNRGRVYGLALDGMLHNLEKKNTSSCSNTSDGLRASSLRTILKSLAFEAHSQGRGRGIRDFRRPLIEKAIRSCCLADFGVTEWTAVEDVIKKGQLPALTWFSEDGQDTFRFAHLTFQEFLCAEFCLARCQKSEDFVFELRELICSGGPEEILRRGWWQQSIQMFCDLSIATDAKHSSGSCWGTVLGECLLQLGAYNTEHPSSGDVPVTSAEWENTSASDCSPDGASSSGQVEEMDSSWNDEAWDVDPRGRSSESRATAPAASSTVDYPRGVNDTNILTVLSMLRGSRSLQQLFLGGGLTSNGISTIRTLQVSSLRVLRLNNNQIGPEGCLAIAQFLQKTSSPVEEIQLVHNILCQGAAKENMPPPSRRNPPTGYYDSYHQDTGGLRELLKAIHQHPTMRVLDVRGNFLPLEAGTLLFEAVKANRYLKSVCGVDLSELRQGKMRSLELRCHEYFTVGEGSFGRGSQRDNRFLSTGGAYFVMLLLLEHPQPELEKIEIANQGLASDHAGAVELYDALGRVASQSCKLEVLDISGFWDSGTGPGQALGRHLASHTSLTELCVGTGSIDWKDLREKGRSGKADVILHLGQSRMRDCGAGILSQCLPPNVTKLDMKEQDGKRGAGLGASGYKVLSQCPHLKEIDGVLLNDFKESQTSLDFSSRPPQAAGAVAAILARTVLTPNLQHLNLSGSNLTSKSHIHPLTPVCGGSGGIGCNGGCDCRNYQGTNAYTHCAECDLDFCSTCCMSPCPMIDLAESLKRLPHLISLKLADCCFQGGRLGPVRSHLDIEGYRVLGDALRRHPSIRELDLSKNFFQGPGFPHLLRGVADMEALSFLTLGSEPISFQEILSCKEIQAEGSWHSMEVLLLCLAIRRNKHLRRLDLSQVTIMMTAEMAADLVASLHHLRHHGSRALEEVHLPNDIRLPLRQMEEGVIDCLDLSRDQYINFSAMAPLLVFVLQRCRLLKDVDFRNIGFGLETEHIIDAVLDLFHEGRLSSFNGIPVREAHQEEFSMSREPVMPHGICVFASTYLARRAGAHALRSLDLQRCGLDGRSLGAVLSALLQLNTVTTLDISGQALKKAGIEQLTTFLRADKKLEILRARSIMPPQSSSADMLEFAKAMEINSTLVVLDLRENRIHGGIAERLRRTMEEKRRTVPLSLDAKICFLLCNRHLPGSCQLPEVSQVYEASRLYTGGAHSPLFMIFQYCGQPRQLLLDQDCRDRGMSSHFDDLPGNVDDQDYFTRRLDMRGLDMGRIRGIRLAPFGGDEDDFGEGVDVRLLRGIRLAPFGGDEEEHGLPWLPVSPRSPSDMSDSDVPEDIFRHVG